MTTSLSNILDALTNLEDNMASLYQWYAEIFRQNEPVHAFFTKMHREEEEHRELLAFQNQIAVNNMDIFDEIEHDVDDIEKISEAVLTHMVQSQPSLADAIRFALEMETTAAESYGKEFLIDVNEDLRELIHSLAQFDQGHAQTIVDFSKSLGINPQVEC